MILSSVSEPKQSRLHESGTYHICLSIFGCKGSWLDKNPLILATLFPEILRGKIMSVIMSVYTKHCFPFAFKSWTCLELEVGKIKMNTICHAFIKEICAHTLSTNYCLLSHHYKCTTRSQLANGQYHIEPLICMHIVLDTHFYLPPVFEKRWEILLWVPSPSPPSPPSLPSQPSPRMFCLTSRLLLKLAFWNLACEIYAKTILLNYF